mmetsp:Transcript_38460/g.68820  ORF Transcript_38460/g.68820 Transcript_38460/m.68820 type:complete len:203 (-) Transcript_38460:2835-3443(-)
MGGSLSAMCCPSGAGKERGRGRHRLRCAVGWVLGPSPGRGNRSRNRHHCQGDRHHCWGHHGREAAAAIEGTRQGLCAGDRPRPWSREACGLQCWSGVITCDAGDQLCHTQNRGARVGGRMCDGGGGLPCGTAGCGEGGGERPAAAGEGGVCVGRRPITGGGRGDRVAGCRRPQSGNAPGVAARKAVGWGGLACPACSLMPGP